MVEPSIVVVEPAEAAATDSKWVKGISADQRVFEVAGRVLDARLKAMCHWLPLAAEKSDEDIEYVHQLRISVRRVAEAARTFSGLIEQAEYDALQERLRRIRLAADGARNVDVMCERFLQCSDGIAARMLENAKARRREAQESIVAVYQEYRNEAWGEKTERLVHEVESHQHGEGKRRFGRQARQYLAPVVRKFFKAAESDLTIDDSLHNLRIRSKKLRYTMEIVAVTFDSIFRKKLYPRVTLFQNLLGTINDHATAKTLFGDVLSNSEDAEQRAFLEGVLLAEERASDDLKAGFLATWTPEVVSDLKRQFRAYCEKC